MKPTLEKIAAALGGSVPAAEFHGTYLKRKDAKKAARKYDEPRVRKITTGQSKGKWTVVTGPRG